LFENQNGKDEPGDLGAAKRILGCDLKKEDEKIRNGFIWLTHGVQRQGR
jgi:hypothetical protein